MCSSDLASSPVPVGSVAVCCVCIRREVQDHKCCPRVLTDKTMSPVAGKCFYGVVAAAFRCHELSRFLEAAQVPKPRPRAAPAGVVLLSKSKMKSCRPRPSIASASRRHNILPSVPRQEQGLRQDLPMTGRYRVLAGVLSVRRKVLPCTHRGTPRPPPSALTPGSSSCSYQDGTTSCSCQDGTTQARHRQPNGTPLSWNANISFMDPN